MRFSLYVGDNQVGGEPLSQGLYVVERGGGQNMVFISGGKLGTTFPAIAGPHPTVSRRHLSIGVLENTVRVEDSGSKYGTFIDNERIVDSREIITAGTYNIRLGKTFHMRLIAEESQ